MSLLNNPTTDSLNKLLVKKSPEEIISSIAKNYFKNKVVYVCSFGAESAIILHIISKISKDFPIIFINTLKLFEETIIYKENLIKSFGLNNCINLYPDVNDVKKYDSQDNLWNQNQNKCCEIRKVKPLDIALKGYKAWISGRKGYHNEERKGKDIVEFQNNKFIISPLILKSYAEINNYFLKYKLLRHPLYKEGYLSIGCKNCTSKVNENGKIRSGRWLNSTKTECGIHFDQKD